jgi:hypothetical protein
MHTMPYLWRMARKLVLSGPAAEAVERLARSAGISPAELIRRALRREDEAQRSAAEKPDGEAQMNQPSPVPQKTQTPRDLGSDTTGRANPYAGFLEEESVVIFESQSQEFQPAFIEEASTLRFQVGDTGSSSVIARRGMCLRYRLQGTQNLSE